MSEMNLGGLAFPKVVSKGTWLSEIPVRWDVDLVKRLFRFNSKTRVSTTDQVLSLTRRGVIERDISGNDGQLAESYEKYPEVKEGDFVLNPMDLIAGWVAKTNIKGKVSSAYFTFHLSDTQRGYAPFFELVFQTYYREKIFDPFGSGLGRMESGGGRWTLGRDVFMNFPIPVPPIDEQISACKYLAKETTHIDLLISKKEQLIEKLLERRQSLITHVVTKGLKPLQSIRPGTDWSGEVSSDWEVEKASRLFRARKGSQAAKLSAEYCASHAGDFPVYSGQTENHGIMAYVDSFEFDSGTSSVLLTTTVGSSKVMTVRRISGRFSLSQNCMILENTRESKLNNAYAYWMVTAAFNYKKLQLEAHMQNSFRMSDFYSYRLLVPPLEEQIQIASHLDSESLQIDTVVDASRRAIELLKERRQSLITQVVTGKIDVRGFASGNP